MMQLIETSSADAIAPAFPPVNRARLARYLELPSLAALDPVTDAEIRKLDERRHDLLSISQRAIELPIERIDGRWIQLLDQPLSIESTETYCRQLRDAGADSLIIAALTIGGRVDDAIKAHLAREQVYEAFVLKQWAATMTEQARVELTQRLAARSDDRHLLPYDGPGYNGWPLRSLHALLAIAYGHSAVRPIRASESGVLLPTNSMVIVYGVTSQRIAIHTHDRLAQCTRCSMRNCNYRMVGV